jgi:hypothetical protein
MIGFAAQRLMELEVSAKTGAGRRQGLPHGPPVPGQELPAGPKQAGERAVPRRMGLAWRLLDWWQPVCRGRVQPCPSPSSPT